MAFNPKYNATPSTLLDGQYGSGELNEDGSLKVSSGTEGAVSDTAWNGTDPDATVISLLKAIWEKLSEIEVNTTPTP